MTTVFQGLHQALPARCGLRVTGILCCVALLTIASPAFAESIPRTTVPPDLDAPPASVERLPKTTADLQVFERALLDLLPHLKQCTVNIRIGPAQGTGVIVSPDGLVLCAAHVSGPPGQEMVITLANGKEYKGEALGRNTAVDCSMVQIVSVRDDWPHCSLGVSRDLEQGDWCLTLGHPGGWMDDRGLVLRLGRVIHQNKWMIQSDCELIGGDSGGPLFDIQGRVVGINTQIGEDLSYNFHVPIDNFSRDWERLLASESFKTHSGAYLGVSGTPHESGLGLLITKVYPRDPAHDAGILEGDILITFQANKVKDLPQLVELVGRKLPGQRVHLELLRDGKLTEVNLKLGMRWE